MTKHLLLAGLGDSPDALVEIIDWFENRSKWRTPPPEHLPAVDEMWVITTRKKRDKLQALINSIERHFRGTKLVILPRYCEIDDITTRGEHDLMCDIIYRAVLHGHHWKFAQQHAFFSVCLAGGRKTMASVFQEAANFFAVDALFHVVSQLEDDGKQQFNPGIPGHRDKVVPFCLVEQPSPWSEIREALWSFCYPQIPLTPEKFDFAKGQFYLPNDLHGPANRKEESPLVSTQTPLSLSDAVRTAAATTSDFLKLGFRSGTSSSFLRHDVSGLLQSMLAMSQYKNSREIKAIKEYCEGLSLQGSIDAPGKTIRGDELADIIEKATMFASRQYVKRDAAPASADYRWLNPDLFEVVLNVQSGLLFPLCGLKPQEWLIILRNLLANIYLHGYKFDHAQTRALVSLCQEEQQTRLVVKNQISEIQHEWLYDEYEQKGNLAALLYPLYPKKSNHDGLGLFTVVTLLNKSNSPARVALKIVKKDNCDFFVVTLVLADAEDK